MEEKMAEEKNKEEVKEKAPAVNVELSDVQKKIKQIETELPVLKKLEKSMLDYQKLSKK
jgi:hypothetical protein